MQLACRAYVVIVVYVVSVDDPQRVGGTTLVLAGTCTWSLFPAIAFVCLFVNDRDFGSRSELPASWMQDPDQWRELEPSLEEVCRCCYCC